MSSPFERPKIEGSKTSFTELYPKGVYEEIHLDQIPESIRAKVAERVSRFSVGKEGEPKSALYFQIMRDDGVRVFGAKYDSEYGTIEDFDATDEPIWKLERVEPSFYLYELGEEDKELGRGGVRYMPDLGFPIVDYVESGEKGTGLGTERYRLMSALSRKFFGKNLHSSTAISPEAERVWERLYGETDRDGKPKEREAEIVESHVVQSEDGSDTTVHRYRLLFPA